MKNNNIILSGKITKKPEYSHESHGELFFEFELSVKRKSETVDRLPCIISEILVQRITESEVEDVALVGEVRTWNEIVSKDESRLHPYVFVRDVLDYAGNLNSIVLHGFIAKPPTYRRTPSDRELTNLLLAVNRERIGRADYVPCLIWGRTAQKVNELPVGTELKVTGRLQSRTYIKQTDDEMETSRTVYEVSVSDTGVIEWGEEE